MPNPEHVPFDPHSVYEDIQGEIVPSHVPCRFSVQANEIIKSAEQFEQELRRPDIQEKVQTLHDNGFVVAAKHKATEIIFDVAKHRKAIVGGAVTAAGVVGAYHIFYHRSKNRG